MSLPRSRAVTEGGIIFCRLQKYIMYLYLRLKYSGRYRR